MFKDVEIQEIRTAFVQVVILVEEDKCYGRKTQFVLRFKYVGAQQSMTEFEQAGLKE